MGRAAIESHDMQSPAGLAAGVGADLGRRVGSDNPVPLLQVRRSPLKIRLVGENFDVLLKMTTPEDFELVEYIVAREKAITLRTAGG